MHFKVGFEIPSCFLGVEIRQVAFQNRSLRLALRCGDTPRCLFQNRSMRLALRCGDTPRCSLCWPLGVEIRQGARFQNRSSRLVLRCGDTPRRCGIGPRCPPSSPPGAVPCAPLKLELLPEMAEMPNELLFFRGFWSMFSYGWFEMPTCGDTCAWR